MPIIVDVELPIASWRDSILTPSMAQTDTSSLPSPDLEDLEALVLGVFARVWEEFSLADAEYCEIAIGSLAVTSVAEDTNLSTGSEGTEAQPRDIYHLDPPTSSVDTPFPDPPKLHIPRICVEADFPTLTLPPAVEPYPEYESWTPTNRSIFRGDDSDDMQFLPFADEPGFDKQAYVKFFKTLAWQGGEQMDADCESPLSSPPFVHLFHELWLDYSRTDCARGGASTAF